MKVKFRRLKPGASHTKQGGAVLVVSLIVLLVLTVVVLSANRDVVIQERSTAAIQDSNLVFQAAETALVDAEEFIDELRATENFFDDDGFTDVATNPFLYNRGTAPRNYLDESIWTDAMTRSANSVDGNFGARYFIEDLGQVPLEDRELSLRLETSYGQFDVPPTARLFRIVVRAVGTKGFPVRYVTGFYSADV